MKGIIFLAVLFCIYDDVFGTAKRQAPQICDPFANIVNPCDPGATTVEYFSHPKDKNKFLECQLGNMMILQCPGGEVFNPAIKNCLPQTISATTLPPVSGEVKNPCNVQNLLTSGKLYFTYPSDNTKFIQCEADGTASIMPCPSPLIWNEALLSCAYSFNTNNPTSPTVHNPVAPGLIKNPCTGITIPLTGLFFSHPNPTKFIQCDIAGDAYVLECPLGLVWNEVNKVCKSPFLVQGPTATPATV